RRSGSAEQPFEQVRQVRSPFCLEAEALKTPGTRPSPAAAVTAAAEAAPERHLRIAVLVDLAAVVLRPLILVHQQVVGGGDLRESLRGVRLILVPVRVKLLRQAAI